MTNILVTAREIAAALAYLHTSDVLHGDLTGNNILLASSHKDTRAFTVKVQGLQSMLLRLRKHHVGLIVALPVLHSLLGCGPGKDHSNHAEVLLYSAASKLVQLVRMLTCLTLQLTCSQF